MIIKTHGLVLRYWPYSNTSRIVSWLTPDLGRISTLIKGSQRPRSFFLAQYDLFQTCELVLYLRSATGLHLARECCPMIPRHFLRTDWHLTALASYFTDLVYRFSPDSHACSQVYDFINQHLDLLDTPRIPEAYLYWYEFKLLEVLGIRPQLQNCIVCRKSVMPQQPPTFFSCDSGGIVCENCAKKQLAPGAHIITPDIFATLLSWQRSENVQTIRTQKLTPRQHSQIHHILGNFIEHHLDTQPDSRRVALEILTAPPQSA